MTTAISNYRKCSRCGHEWIRKGDVEPKQCPKCRSAKWQQEMQVEEVSK